MYVADPPSPTGWPWPLDSVQGWFEDLWDWVLKCATDAANWIWSFVKPAVDSVISWITERLDWLWVDIRNYIGWWDPALNRFVGGFLGWLWDILNEIARMISEAAGWVWEGIEPTISAVAAGFRDLCNWIWGALDDWLSWLAGIIWGWIDGSLRWLTDTFRWLQGEVGAIVGDAQTAIITAFDGAFGGIVEVFTGWPELLTNAISAIFEPLLLSLGATPTASSPQIFVYPLKPLDWYKPQIGWLEGVIGKGLEAGIRWLSEQLSWFTREASKWLDAKVITPLWEGLKWLWDFIVDKAQDAFTAVENLFKGFSSITPEDAYALSPKVLIAAAGLGLAATGITSVAGIKVVGTGLEVGEIGSYIKDLLSPSMFVGATLGTLIGVGLTTPLRYYYQKAFTPLIPPIPDLIRFVVREVIPPETFYDLAGYHGYSEERAKWFWEAHWILPAFGNVVDARHRGLISEEELEKFLIWHDYSPEPRPGIEKTDVEIMRGLLKTLIPRVDLRYAWELGRLTDEQLVEWYEKLGYEEDSPLMAEIQMARALVEEIHKIRDEWIRAYTDGFIDEDTLRANLAEIGIGPARVDYYAVYARMRRDREYSSDLLTLYEDSYLKDLDTKPPFEDFVRQELVDPAMAELFIRRAYVRKYKKPKEVKPEEAKLLPVSDLKRAFREGIITEDELRAELEARGYAPEDIDIIVAIEKEKME